MFAQSCYVSCTVAVNNWQEHDFFLLQSFSYLFPFCFVAMICRFPFRKELFSDFSAHNWMLHLRRKIQVKEERRIGGQIIVICFSSPFMFLDLVYLNILIWFAIGVGPEYMRGTRFVCEYVNMVCGFISHGQKFLCFSCCTTDFWFSLE